MSDEKTAQIDAQLEPLRQKNGKLVVLEIDGKVLAFKLMNRAKVQQLKIETSKKPELAFDMSINACEFLCVFGQQHFSELAAQYPLAFVGSDDEPGVFNVILEQAHGDAKITVR